MTNRLCEIWRHPIKAIGRERVASAHLRPGQSLPWDRHWAVTHDRAQIEDGWMACRNFVRAASSPSLMAVSCDLDDATGMVTLRHPDRPDLTIAPVEDAQTLIQWLSPLITPGRPAPNAVIALPGRGFTDSGTPGITIGNLSSHRTVEQRVGRSLSRHRWRANIWLEGTAPWEEFEWVDRHIRIGTATLKVYGRTQRCRATESNPDTGVRDTDTLGALSSWDHQDFTVKATVIEAGDIAEGDHLEVL